MFKLITVNNFKSLVDFSIDLTGTTLIIGDNGSGKTSVLQAIEFLCACAKEDFDAILKRRGWRVDNIKSKLIESDKLTFNANIALGKITYKWTLVLSLNKNRNDIKLFSEEIQIDGVVVFKNDKGKAFLQFPSVDIDAAKNTPVLLQNKASSLRVLDGVPAIDIRLQKLIDFLKCSESFELLSPHDMRLSSRGKTDTIGVSGRDLPSFIKNMDDGQRKRFMRKIKMLLNGRIAEVGTRSRQLGWTQIEVKEHYKKVDIQINSAEMSDGMLRLLAFLAISEINRTEAAMLLDEIENGVNADYAEGLIKVFRQAFRQKKHQMVLTTHSNIFADYIDPEDIRYVFRDDQGITHAGNPFLDEEFRSALEYMWPGEIVLNNPKDIIIEKMLREI